MKHLSATILVFVIAGLTGCVIVRDYICSDPGVALVPYGKYWYIQELGIPKEHVAVRFRAGGFPLGIGLLLEIQNDSNDAMKFEVGKVAFSNKAGDRWLKIDKVSYLGNYGDNREIKDHDQIEEITAHSYLRLHYVFSAIFPVEEMHDLKLKISGMSKMARELPVSLNFHLMTFEEGREVSEKAAKLTPREIPSPSPVPIPDPNKEPPRI